MKRTCILTSLFVLLVAIWSLSLASNNEVSTNSVTGDVKMSVNEADRAAVCCCT